MLSRFDLQERLARFMGSEEAILYSYDLATLPSIIPAFASKKDLILCDEVSSSGSVWSGWQLEARMQCWLGREVSPTRAYSLVSPPLSVLRPSLA